MGATGRGLASRKVRFGVYAAVMIVAGTISGVATNPGPSAIVTLSAAAVLVLDWMVGVIVKGIRAVTANRRARKEALRRSARPTKPRPGARPAASRRTQRERRTVIDA